MLREIIDDRNPHRIGINTGSVAWAAGGLTHNLYQQLTEALSPDHVDLLCNAEPLAVRWLSTLTAEEIRLYEQVAEIAHAILAECYSPAAITPGVTTTQDLEWHYWQRCTDLGLPVSFKPYFRLVRSDRMKHEHGDADTVIRPGDCVHSDVGFHYLRLTSDHQQMCYIRQPGESDAPAGLRRLMQEANRLQDVYLAGFSEGLTGNEMLAGILKAAHEAGIPNPRVYSHSLGLYLHEPGPLIGLPWEQQCCPGRGDVRLTPDTCFTMELSVSDAVAEWDGQEVVLPLEEDVVFASDGCRMLDGRQTAFHLI